MTPATFRSVREGLGLPHAWLAARWDIATRTIERWEAGTSPVPQFAEEDLQVLEMMAAEHVTRHVAALRGHRAPVLTIEDDPDAWPARWQRAVAFRVRQQVPATQIVNVRSPRLP